MEQMDFSVFWPQCQDVVARYGCDGDGRSRVYFRIFRHAELLKLGRVVGMRNLLRAVETSAQLAPGEVHFVMHGVPIVYSPLSLWPQETFLIDADGVYRTAYSIGHTLVDLRRGNNDHGEDLRGYSVEQLAPDFDLVRLYERCVDQWWRFKGKRSFEEEIRIFEEIRG